LASGRFITTLLTEVVRIYIIVSGALSDAFVVIPEGSLTFSAVTSNVKTLGTYWIAVLTGHKIVEKKGSTYTI
jgi:hypothetical protein